VARKLLLWYASQCRNGSIHVCIAIFRTMSRKGRHRRPSSGGPGRTSPRGTRPSPPATQRPGGDQADKFLDDLAQVIDADGPYELIRTASTFVELLRARPANATAPSRHMSPPEIIESFIGVDNRETTGLLTALALMLDDEVAVARMKRELERRVHHLPRWLRMLATMKVEGVWEMVDPLGDGDNHLLGIRFESGHAMTAIVYIDHNMGTVVKDAFLLPASIDDVITHSRELAEPGVTLAPLDPAIARRRIEDAIRQWESTIPVTENDTWPACRAAVEWMIRSLPTGGTGYTRPDWSDADRRELAVRFFLSPIGSPLAAWREHHDLVHYLIDFACETSSGDPMRWSAVSVEIVLVDWFPSTVVLDLDELERLPEVLRAFVRFAHGERAVAPELTAEALANVDRYEGEYQRLIRAPDAIAMREVVGLAAERLFGDLDTRSYEEMILEDLAEEVGGAEELARLDADPLPDEPFVWDGIATDIRPRVEAILELVDRYCTELLDAEYRTCCRRLLARAADGDPAIFRRRSRDENTAAAVVWIAGKFNHLFDGYGVLVKDLMAWFGIGQGSVSQRAASIRQAVGLPGDSYSWNYGVQAGDAALIVSRRRAAIIASRDKALRNS
jgi:hypothetical protein